MTTTKINIYDVRGVALDLKFFLTEEQLQKIVETFSDYENDTDMWFETVEQILYNEYKDFQMTKGKQFIVQCTVACFGTLEKFYKEFAKGNRRVFLEDIEFEGEEEFDKDEQHNTGIIRETLTVENDIVSTLRNWINLNNLERECFGIYDINDYHCGEELATEEILN